jgi:hypothetical protein
VNAAYANNSLERSATLTFTLDQANLAGGIKSCRLLSSLGAYQFEFNNPVPKDNTKIFAMTFKVAWARHP